MIKGKTLSGEDRIRRIQTGASITKWAVLLCTLSVVFFWAEDGLSILFPAHPYFEDVASIDIGEGERSFAEMTLNQRLPLLALVTVSYALLAGITLSVYMICLRFQAADFFSRKSWDSVFFSGVWFISFAVFNIAASPIATYVATLDYPENERSIDVAFSHHEIFALILGALLLLLGWVMREAALLAEENRQII